MNRQRQRYLRTRAATAPWRVAGTTRADFSAAVVIPALAERDNLPATFASLSLNPPDYLARTLVIVVVSNRTDVSREQFSNNRATLEWLRCTPCPRLNLAWVDASSPGLELPAREGVGLARKIGFDAALRRLNGDAESLLISLDADTLVDATYLAAIFSHFQHHREGGAALPFRHQPAERRVQEQAIRHYELYLRSYLFGLQCARSPYAYHTIGSAFACRAASYIKAGGMNRRSAGEDFYFLQQLAKVAGVALLEGTVVHPSPRFSDRVPFGTGKAVEKQVVAGEKPFNFVAVDGFRTVKEWLELMARDWDRPAEEILSRVAESSPVLNDFLNELNFSVVWEKLRCNHTSRSQRLRAFHHWFDALRTRQLLSRSMTDRALPVEKCVAELLAWGGYPGMERETDQLQLLERLQGAGG